MPPFCATPLVPPSSAHIYRHQPAGAAARAFPLESIHPHSQQLHRGAAPTCGSICMEIAEASCALRAPVSPSWRARSAKACGSSSSANAGFMRAMRVQVDSEGLVACSNQEGGAGLAASGARF